MKKYTALLRACYQDLSPGHQPFQLICVPLDRLEEEAERKAERTSSVMSGHLGIRKSSGLATDRCKRF